MPSKETIEKINNFTEEAWRRYYYARHVRVVRQFEKMGNEDIKKSTRGLLDEQLLLRRMETDTGFNRMLRRKLAKVEWIESHVQELGALVVLDILHPKQPTMKVTDEIGSDMTRRNLQRLIREYYPELFVFPESDTDLDDRRETPFRSIFTATSISLPDEDIHKLVYTLMSFEDEQIRGLIREKFSEVIKLNLPIRLVDPDENIGLLKFHERISLLAGTIKGWWKDIGEDTNWIIDRLSSHGIMPDQLHQMLYMVVLLRWFSQRSPIERKKLLHGRYKLIYTSSDAARAISSNCKWFTKSCDVFDIMNGGADAYLKLGQPQIARVILEECLNIPDLEDFDRAICYEGIAECMRDFNKPKEMLIQLELARKIWEAMNSTYDLARNWSGVAQAYHLMDKKKEFFEAWKHSKDLLLNTGMPPDQQAYILLYAADDAVQVHNRAWEKEALEIGNECSSKMKKTDLFLYLNQRLIDLNAGKNTWQAEQEPGKLKHPIEHRAYWPKGEYYIPILPSQIDGELAKRPKVKHDSTLK